VPVLVAPVQLLDYAPAIELVGEIRAVKRATLAAEVSGRVTRIASRVGEAYSTGQGALIQIDPADYHTGLAQAEANLAQAREALNQARTGPREQTIAAQQAQVTAAEAQLAQAEDNLKRQEKLYDAGVIPESTVVAARTQANAARAQLESQQEILSEMRSGTRPEQIAQAEAAVAAAQARVDQARLALNKTGIRPVFDGVVAALMVEVGTFVGPGTPVAEVVAEGPHEAWFNLPEKAIPHVTVGDKVELTTDAFPDEVFHGTVISISTAANPVSRQFPVRVALTNRKLLPGMAAYCRIMTQTPKPTAMISRDATVMNSLGQQIVYVMQPPAESDPGTGADGGQQLPGVKQVVVELGDTYRNMVVLSSNNIEPGQMLVTRGNEKLNPTSKIIPTNLGGPPTAGEGAAPPGAPPAGEGSPAGAPAAGEEQIADPPAEGAGR
jgi:RND family efflux transporter MFP subunit